MKFKTVAEAFNHYRNFTLEALEKRAQEVQGMIETDPDVDIDAINIELRGIKEAKDNITEKNEISDGQQRSANISVLANMSMESRAFDADTVFDSPEYRSAFLKSLLGQQLNTNERNAFNVGMQAAEKRTDYYNTSGDSAAILPTSMLNEIVKKARTMGGLMAECRAFALPTKISIPVATPSSKAAWHTEGDAVATDKTSIAAVTFDGYEIIKIFSLSVKVRKMSIAAFESYLVDELTACVMDCIADALVNGSGSGEGSGLETITWVKTAGATQNAVEVAANKSIAYADVIALAGLLKRGYAQNAKMAMNNKTLYNTFFTMQDANAHPIFVAKQLGEAKAGDVGRILGFDVVIDDNIADDVIYLGNFAKYLGYNLPSGIAIEMSKDSGFRSGLIDYRAMAIADCKPIVSEAFVKLYKAAAQ